MRTLKYEIFNQANEKIDEVISYREAVKYAEQDMTFKEKFVEPNDDMTPPPYHNFKFNEE